MTCSRSRPGLKPRATRFFKSVLNRRADRLRIPKDFTARLGLVLANPVSLQAPYGPELINSNGEFWRGEGWPEFREHYSIDFGQFLVFKYLENSKFRVLIFDRSAPEIKYPSDDAVPDESPESGSESNSDDSVQVLDSDDPTTEIVSVEISGKKGKKDGGVICLDKGRSVAYQRAMAIR